MPVSNAFKSLPVGVPHDELGQVATVTQSYLVATLHSPVAVNQIQQYLVFPSATIGPNVASYAWTITDGGTTVNETTTDGRLLYSPLNTGTLGVSVEIRNGAGSALATLTLSQQSMPLLPELETLMDAADRGPAAAHPSTSREIVNNYKAYVDGVVSATAEPLLNRLLLSIMYSHCMRKPWLSRNREIQSALSALNGGNHASFLGMANNGMGICGIRPQLAAMAIEKSAGVPFIAWTELPASRSARRTAIQTIETNFNALTADEIISFFHRLAIPRLAIKTCLAILNKLKDTYFSGQSWQDVLGDRTKGRKLLMHYDSGPWAADQSANRFARSTFTMIGHPVWQIAARALAGGASSGGGTGSSSGTPPAAPAPIGTPEIISEYTFIAQPSPTDNGYIRMAELYHETYGLQPQIVDSWEEIIDTLAGDTGTIDRVRIVSHFYYPSASAPANAESNMLLPFFSGGTFRTLKDTFKFAISDVEGILGYLKVIRFPVLEHGWFSNWINVSYPGAGGTTRTEPLWKGILRAIRLGPDAAVLQPFGMQTTNPTSPSMVKILKCMTDLMALKYLNIELVDSFPTATVSITADPDIIVAFNERILEMVDALKPSVLTASRTASQLEDILNAIWDFDPNDLVIPKDLTVETFSVVVAEPTYLQNHDAFRALLNTVRGRVAATTHIDIRGCQIGRDNDYMQAVDTFLSNGSISPVVTAPEWFQSFPVMPFSLLDSESAIDSAFRNGVGGLASSDVQREYENWSGRIGITGQILFWQQVAAFNDFDFLKFTWRQNMPGLALTPVRLDNFQTLTFPQTVQRIGEIFNITAHVPAGIQTFETNHRAHITQLVSLADSLSAMSASTPVAQLNTANTTLQALAGSLGQTLPAAPTPMTLDYLNNSISTLKQYLVGQSGITPFKTNLSTKVNHANAGFRYLLRTGFPLHVQKAADEDNVRLLMFDPVKNDALDIWMKMQFSGTQPAGSMIGTLTPVWSPPTRIIPNSSSTKNDDDLTDLGRGLQTAMLTDRRNPRIFAINPTYEYADHIKTF